MSPCGGVQACRREGQEWIWGGMGCLRRAAKRAREVDIVHDVEEGREDDNTLRLGFSV